MYVCVYMYVCMYVCIYIWQARSDSFESPLFFIWSAWFTIDLALVCSKGHTHRQSLLSNRALLLSCLAYMFKSTLDRAFT